MDGVLLDMSDGSQTPQRPLRKPGSNHGHRRQIIVCLMMHVVLILVHAALFVVWSHHYERNFVANINSFTDNWLPSIVTVITQTVGVVYLALLVLVTQRLALRSDLYTRQTLTAIHDKNDAWLGLGSAVVAVYQQFQVHAAAVGVACIALYLTGVFVLHITIPTLLHVQPFNETISTVYATTLAYSDFAYGTLQSYDILSVYGQFPALGLLDNMVYDVIPTVASAIGNTTVNATVFDIECTAIPGAAQIAKMRGPEASSGATPYWYIIQMDNLTTVEVPTPYYPAVWTSSGFQVNYGGPDCNSSTAEVSCWNPIVVSSTVPVVDSSGASPARHPWIAIEPQVVQPSVLFDSNTQTYGWAEISAIQMIACSVSVKATHIDVSAESRLPVSYPIAPSTVQWKNYTRPPNAQLLLNDSRVGVAQNIPSRGTPSLHSFSETLGVYDINGAKVTDHASAPIYVPIIGDKSDMLQNLTNSLPFITLEPSTFDMFLNEDLGLTLHNQTNVSLADLNLSIGRALAAIYWYSRNLNYSDPHSIFESQGRVSDPNQNATAEQGEAIIMISTLKARLNLGLTPLAIGLVASVILLSLSVVLIRLPTSSREDINTRTIFDSAGILQLAWLLGHEPRLATVKEPRVNELRSAGMFEIHMGEVAEQKVYSALSNDI